MWKVLIFGLIVIVPLCTTTCSFPPKPIGKVVLYLKFIFHSGKLCKFYGKICKYVPYIDIDLSNILDNNLQKKIHN